MKLVAEVEGEKLTLDARREEGARVVAEIAGRRYELEARDLGVGAYLLLHEGTVYQCRVGPGARGVWEVRVGGRTYGVSLADPKRLRGAQGAVGHDGGRAEISSPMPGKVVRVLVEEGQVVEAGEGVVIVEAMKMQNELKSPKSGTVVELRASAGSTVNAGDVLAVVE